MPMKHHFLSTLMSTFLALHTVLGCCWHHAHACESGGDVQPAQGQCPDSFGSGVDHANQGPRACQGGQCSFVSSSSPNSDSFAQPFQAFIILLLNDQHPLVGSGSEQHFFAPGWLQPPVRLHLANQVMLI